jgi:DNA-binding transcriptional ArsR family regulator
MLRGRPLTVGEIADRLGISQPSTSQHLAALREAGMVRDQRKGQYVYYELVPETFARYHLGTMAFGCDPDSPAWTEQMENYRRFLKEELDRVDRVLKKRHTEKGDEE